MHFCMSNAYRLQSEDLGEAVIDAAEAHEGHSQQAGHDEGDGHALHPLGDVHHGQLLTYGSEDGESQAEAESGGNGKDDAGQEVRLKPLSVVGALSHKDSYAEDGAVGGDEGQEDAERLVQCGRYLLQDDLHHLHEGGDDEDEGDGLQIDQVVLDQENLNEIGDNRGDGEHESHSSGHTKCGIHFLRHTEERADPEELREDDVIDEDG